MSPVRAIEGGGPSLLGQSEGMVKSFDVSARSGPLDLSDISDESDHSSNPYIDDIELQDQSINQGEMGNDDRFDEEQTNSDVNYYPNVSRRGRHTAIPNDSDDIILHKETRRERVIKFVNSDRPRYLIVGTGAIIMVVTVMALVILGRNSDAGGGVRSANPSGYSDSSDLVSLAPIFDDVSTPSKKNLTLKEELMGLFYSSTYNAEFIEVEESSSLDEGYYIHRAGSIWLLKKAADAGYEKKLFDTREPDYDGDDVSVKLVKLNIQLNKALVMSDAQPLFRHSTLAKYWLLDLSSMQLEPIYKLENGDVPKLSFAMASPKMNYVSFVYNNDLYIRDIAAESVLSITQDGSVDVFNGRPDWVYEEEVLGAGNAIYWTPDESKLAYITFNDTEVEDYNLEFFKDYQYPIVEPLKYPKTGSKNPRVAVSVYNIEQGVTQNVNHKDSKLGDDFIVYDIAWITGNELLIKETDRTSRSIDFRLYNVETDESKVVRSVDTSSFGGWYYGSGSESKMFVLPDGRGYVDMTVVGKHNRLAYFDNAESQEPAAISGDSKSDWEVMTSVIGYNQDDQTLYFIGTAGSAIQRFVYQWSLNENRLVALTNTSMIESYGAKFSANGKYCMLEYKGPDVPWQRFVDVKRFMSDAEYRKNKNRDKNTHFSQALYDTLGYYDVPSKLYQTLKMEDNVTIEFVEVRPANFDSKNKYPVLVSVYGGPGLQKLSSSFSFGFEEVVASSLNAVVLYIDPRGTGARDWEFKSYARDNIGYWEPRDITEVTRKFINERGYIDENKTAIWGWSYGGFTTLKTLEYDHGDTFKYGMAVAPVTNWMLYDSIYTERYMGLPKNNKNYDTTSQISNIKNFQKVQRFLIMHGTGDDNVHFQNTLQLLDKFDLAEVENYDIQIFPDSNHNIVYNNARTIVFDKLYSWLENAFEGKYN
ncbi:hypothetical protein FOA43_004594 [Brettanomyces nanus]|uniref:Uncharacterized protein n=1 Tax=Eeniella nana TaxID=13502 RepID=A0A875RY57_EENNA|nr:uncharacterized protein FOA43_004594 [Brettanomyces nanus]QPG77187.1 hypothetical protein FOA43_004594 [Brettanomyces nanus]